MREVGREVGREEAKVFQVHVVDQKCPFVNAALHNLSILFDFDFY